ncbi:site-specific integrase [Nocardioides sp. GY 10127]|uniref:tyrosine-type recombinase/integrase n=1 Tax=Nocardioides sp. GY 10127 TaxID=2569762 RepID=UPI0010A8DB8E|nr:site-specific integrase [Nocardioides sp. GY 10127]TIC78822.1 hypothetical protein E8D37_19185 [Nocardioides sp. GY 10127]
MSKERRQGYGEGGLYQRSSDGRWIAALEAGWTESSTRRRITVSGPGCLPACPARCSHRAAIARKVRDKKAEIAKAAAARSIKVDRKTVKSWADEWLEMREKTKRPKTYESNVRAVRKWIVPTIGTKRLVDLSPRDLRAVETKVARTAGRPSAVLARRILIKMLRDSLTEGYDVPHTVFNAAANAGAPPPSDRTALELDQAVAVLEQAAELPHGTRYLVSFLQGLRQGEALGLTWDSIDFDTNIITVEWQLQPLPYRDKKNRKAGFRVPDDYEVRHLQGRFHLVRPKSRRGYRIIPMVATMRDALLTYRDTAPANPHGLVWARADGWPIDKADDAAEFRALQKAAGVAHPSGRPFVGHEMRNTAAQILKELGVDDVTITAILGHSSYVTSRGYMTSRLAEKRRAIESAAALLAGGAPASNDDGV